MIPKTVHYIWLGNNPKSRLSQLCINSWRRVLSDYEIIEWNENNLDLRGLSKNNIFLQRCLRLKLWAFASDYLRLYILYNYGGIYLDCDIEVLKTYNSLLNYSMFVGLEDGDYIGTGVIGAEPFNPVIKRLLDFYEYEIWNVDFINNPIIFRYLRDSESNLFDNCRILPRDYFSPYTPGCQYSDIVETKNTLSIHWYSKNWNISRNGYVFMFTKHIHNPVLRFFAGLRKSVGYELRRFR